jgi:hypothetical protein
MKIQFERSGGFMGLPLKTTLDTAALPDEEAQTLQQMLSEAQFFELPPAAEDMPDDAPAGADQMTYTVTVIDDQEAHTVCVTDMATPDTLRPLLRHLTLLARRPSGSDQPAEES